MFHYRHEFLSLLCSLYVQQTKLRTYIFFLIKVASHSGNYYYRRHLSNIDCLKVHTACLVCFISTVNGNSKKKKKKPWKIGNSSRHITNLTQSLLETSDIYNYYSRTLLWPVSCRLVNRLWKNCCCSLHPCKRPLSFTSHNKFFNRS
jgi:hypothetical protein